MRSFALFRLSCDIYSRMEQIDYAAYHEAGHVVAAYFTGNACDFSKLDLINPGNGLTKMNYGSDKFIAASMLVFLEDPTIHQALPENAKERASELHEVLGFVLTAGSVAETIFQNDGRPLLGNVKITIAGNDLNALDSVDACLGQIKGTCSNRALVELCKILGVPQVWKAVDETAKALLKHPKKELTKAEIEATLHASGFFAFLKANGA